LGHHTQSLLRSIRRHLTAQNSETLKAYNDVAHAMGKLVKPQKILLVRDYFLSRFPKIQLRDDWTKDANQGSPLLWGMVNKGVKDNQIHIREDVVSAYEKACKDNCNTKWVLSLILLVIVLHEASHALTKDLFDGAITPEGGGFKPTIQCTQTKEVTLQGESGWTIEDLVFGFHLQVEWAWADRGNMGKIRRLIARGPDDGARVLTPEVAEKITRSIKERQLYNVEFQNLEPAPKGGAKVYRARGADSDGEEVIRESFPFDPEADIYSSIIHCRNIRLRNPEPNRMTNVLSNSAAITRDEVPGDDRPLATDINSEDGIQVEAVGEA